MLYCGLKKNCKMKKIPMIGLVLGSFLALSSQVVESLTDLRLSFQLLTPIELVDDSQDVFSEIEGDSINLSVHFQLIDTLNVESIEFILSSDSVEIDQLSYAYSSYNNDFESGLYRDENYLVTNLGVYPFDSLLNVSVRLIQNNEFSNSYYKSITD